MEDQRVIHTPHCGFMQEPLLMLPSLSSHLVQDLVLDSPYILSLALIPEHVGEGDA